MHVCSAYVYECVHDVRTPIDTIELDTVRSSLCVYMEAWLFVLAYMLCDKDGLNGTLWNETPFTLLTQLYAAQYIYYSTIAMPYTS